MPEPLSILAATFGSLNFLVALRNAVWTIACDIDSYKAHTSNVTSARLGLDALHTDMQAWFRLWHIHEGVSMDLFTAYWGRDGREEILAILQDARAKIQELLQRFEKSLGEGWTDVDGADEFLEAKNWSFVDEGQQTKFERLARRYTDQLNPVRRYLRSLLTDKLFIERLVKAADCMDGLQKRSEILFQRFHRLTDEDMPDYRDLMANFEQIRSLSSKVPATIAVLSHGFIPDDDDWTIDLRLDYGKDNPISRARVTEEAAHDGILPMYFVCAAQGVAIDREVNIHCRQMLSRLPGMWEEHSDSFSSAVSKVLSADTADLKPCSEDVWFQLCNEGLSQDQEHEERLSLQGFLSSQSPAASGNDPLSSDMKRDEKIQLAYQLAEWTLFSHKAAFFAKFCTCNIQRVEMASAIISHRLRLGKEGIDSCSLRERLERSQNWCIEGYPTSTVRRLSLLLTEIGLGYQRDPSQKLLDVNRKVVGYMGREYLRTVDYCRKQVAHESSMSEFGVDEFRRNVVEP